MNKVEFIDEIARVSGLKKGEAEKAVSAFVEVVTSALVKGEEIRLLGFGNFCVTRRAASEGRNMQTGETIHVPARNLPKFKPGKNLKEAVVKGSK